MSSLSSKKLGIERLVGSDPEAFLINEHGKFISSIGLIGGTKFMPREMGGGFAIQEDNVAVEVNIPPARSADEFVSSLNRGMEILSREASKYGLILSFTPSVVFTADQLANPQAQVFGCEPDLNCWSKKVNPKPKSKDKALRSSGGHVHLQCEADPWLLGRWMDVFNGIPAIFYDDDTRRRELYGKAGAIRIKDYPGIEYRTLSSAWLRTDDLKRFVFDQSVKAMEMAEKDVAISDKTGRLIRKAINNADKKIALELSSQFDLSLDRLGVQ